MDLSRAQLRRTLSQNFLSNRRAVEQFLSAADLYPDDLVVEVGAGAGALTSRIAALVRKVLAFELDPSLAPSLEASVAGQANVNIVYADFLESVPPAGPFKLVSNVPFGSTSAVVDWAVEAEGLTAATLITQLEYAKKRTGAYGRWSKLTVTTWPDFEWSLRGQIARSNFRPVPSVDAGILHLARRPAPLLASQLLPSWRDLVELGFSGVGGSLFASLCRSHPRLRVAAAFERCGTPTDAVVAFVTPQEWLLIFEALGAVDSTAWLRPPYMA